MSKKASPQDWRAVLVDSFCQSGKTAKCFETINAKIIADGAGATPTLVLFVTQANSTASANQVIQRAKNSPIITKVIPKTNVFKSSVMEPDEFVPTKNTMIVDFWNSRNMEIAINSQYYHHHNVNTIMTLLQTTLVNHFPIILAISTCM